MRKSSCISRGLRKFRRRIAKTLYRMRSKPSWFWKADSEEEFLRLATEAYVDSKRTHDERKLDLWDEAYNIHRGIRAKRKEHSEILSVENARNQNELDRIKREEVLKFWNGDAPNPEKRHLGKLGWCSLGVLATSVILLGSNYLPMGYERYKAWKDSKSNSISELIRSDKPVYKQPELSTGTLDEETTPTVRPMEKSYGPIWESEPTPLPDWTRFWEYNAEKVKNLFEEPKKELYPQHNGNL